MSGENPYEQAKSVVLQLLPSASVTEAQLIDAIDQVLTMMRARYADVTFDRELLRRELESMLNVFQPDAISMSDSSDHDDWYDLAMTELPTDYWERYIRWLREQENLPPRVVDRLETSTRNILRKIENPHRLGKWDRRGLVVGQIQSGKTGNYTGLICRAADAGYPLIVVLAGMHNNLRSQTQLRMDEGFLGFDTQIRPQAGDDNAGTLGVGRLPGAPRLNPASLTTSADKGDFLTSQANRFGFRLGGFPVLVVVKKHGLILDNLRNWLLTTHGTADGTIKSFPILVIDDEADNASINTNDVRDATRELSDDLSPTKVNGAIRLLLNAFEKKAYIGYTATPAANIYIPPDVDHATYGPDLFPKAFIEYLKPPSNYFGPARLFGLDGQSTPLPLRRKVTDQTLWMPDKHKSDLRITTGLPASLKRAMRCFVLSIATRLARAQVRKHNSMLIHVTRFKNVQSQVADQVLDELDDIRGRLRFGDGDGASIRDELRAIWTSDYVRTTASAGSYDGPDVTWPEVEARLEEAVTPIVVKTINGNAVDALEYFDHRETGLNVIVIGGEKLSRGLTLYGLTVSYYLRASRAADTLLQMGRWFGYREGYEDLCRLFTTKGLWQSFREVTLTNEELIDDFEQMASRGLTPDEYGLKIADSMAGMLVTAPNKMREAKALKVGFSGAISETVVLPSDEATASENLDTAGTFIRILRDRYNGDPPRKRGNYIWSGIPGAEVAEHFFAEFRTPEVAWRVHAQTIASYIRNRVAAGELDDWTVALISNASVPEDERTEIGGYRIGPTERNPIDDMVDRIPEQDLFSIRRILNPTDESLDLSDDEWNEALRKSVAAWEANGRKSITGKDMAEPAIPSSRSIRSTRPTSRGLLMIYPLKKVEVTTTSGTTLTADPRVGFAVSFPYSPGAPAMDYVVNQRYLDEIFGGD